VVPLFLFQLVISSGVVPFLVTLLGHAEVKIQVFSSERVFGECIDEAFTDSRFARGRKYCDGNGRADASCVIVWRACVYAGVARASEGQDQEGVQTLR